MTEVVMLRPEPRLSAEGYSESEILEWMKSKVRAVSELERLLADRKNVEQALKILDVKIEKLTIHAALDIVRE